MAFPTPMVWPLDEIQGSSLLQGHGSWLMCEVALNDNQVLMPEITTTLKVARKIESHTHYLNFYKQCQANKKK